MNQFSNFLETLPEIQLDEKSGFIYKVRFTGKKRRKKKCPPGMKPSPGGTSCVPMLAGEKRNRKLGSRKTQRTIRAKGVALKKRKERKRKKAMRFRKAFGLSK